MHHPMSFQRLSDPLHTLLSQLLLRRFILHLLRHANGQRGCRHYQERSNHGQCRTSSELAPC